MRRLVVFVLVAVGAAVPASALAGVTAQGATRSRILRVAVGQRDSAKPCFTVTLAAKRSSWAFVTESEIGARSKTCSGIQGGDYSFLHYTAGRWRVVVAGDELHCPIVSRPVISSRIVRELTGLRCKQPTTAGRHFPRIPTEMLHGGLAVAPREIGFTGDGTGYLGGYTGRSSVKRSRSMGRFPFGSLVWAKWNRRTAEGVGAEWINDGIPDDASGTFHPYQATVWAFRPRGGVFTRMKVTVVVRLKFQTTVYDARHVPADAYSRGYWEW